MHFPVVDVCELDDVPGVVPLPVEDEPRPQGKGQGQVRPERHLAPPPAGHEGCDRGGQQN